MRVAAESPAGILPRVRLAFGDGDSERVLFWRLSASRLIVYGFIALVAGGTALLKLPWATTDGISLLNAFFVAVSCGTVTGLSTVSIPGTFTHFGEVVVMVIMQLGGLGIMTVTTLGALLIGQRIGFRRLLTVSEETENAGSPRNTLRLLFQIARITFAVELVGAVILSVGFIQAGLGVGEGIFEGVFHAIMAFCNAGFATLPGDDLLPYAGNWLIGGSLVCVITLGGLVFLCTVALMVSDGLELLPALFEVTSAFGTVGLSLDVTPDRSMFGKILISVLMFVGRVDPITFIVALAARQRTPHYRYPEEEIAIG
jgi:Trk-type K+ transport system membrane component